MIYYRNYIIQYLDIPGVHSICVEDDVDYRAFYDRFFGTNPEGRKDHQHVRNCLRYELESMVGDGIIDKEEREVRNEHNNRSKRRTFYIKKHQDFKGFMDTGSDIRFVIKNSSGQGDVMYYMNSDYSLVANIQYATRYKSEVAARSDYEYVYESCGGYTEIIQVEVDPKSWRIIEK